MPLYRVKWDNNPRDPRHSHWWVLNGVITAASGMLEKWVGCKHRDLVVYLKHRGRHVFMSSHKEHVPPTLKYHKQLKANVDALLQLIAGDRNGHP